MTYGELAPELDDVDLDRLLALVRGADSLDSPDFDLAPARRRLRSVLRKVYSAKTQKRQPGPDATALKTMAKQAGRLREAFDCLTLTYGQLDNASLAALFEAIRDDGAHPPAMLLDDETNLAIQNADADEYEVIVRPTPAVSRRKDEDEQSYLSTAE